MRIAILTPRFPHERRFIAALADTCRRLGHEVQELDWGDATDEYTAERMDAEHTRADLCIQWGGNPRDDYQSTLHCELGWLPRWSHQVSHTGINAGHHRAQPELERLTAEQEAAVSEHLAAVRRGEGWPGWRYCNPCAAPYDGMAVPFILAPLQIESDTNAAHWPEGIRTQQDFVDYVQAADPPHPVIFKAHPAREQRGAEPILKTYPRGKWKDRIAGAYDANVHQYLKSPQCEAVVTLNSNVSSDALLWDVPVIALGGGFWPSGMWGVDRALTEWRRTDVATLREIWDGEWHTWLRRAYIHHLMRAQWTLDGARDPERVGEAISEAVADG